MNHADPRPRRLCLGLCLGLCLRWGLRLLLILARTLDVTNSPIERMLV